MFLHLRFLFPWSPFLLPDSPLSYTWCSHWRNVDRRTAVMSIDDVSVFDLISCRGFAFSLTLYEGFADGQTTLNFDRRETSNEWKRTTAHQTFALDWICNPERIWRMWATQQREPHSSLFLARDPSPFHFFQTRIRKPGTTCRRNMRKIGVHTRKNQYPWNTCRDCE